MSDETMLIEPLTAREHEVVQLIFDGLTNRKIAKQLVIQPSTVKSHIRQINQKLDTKNRAEIIDVALELGLLETKQTTSDSPIRLPTYTTPFIGRKQEIDDVASLLTQTSTRLITILASGGMGKTRLAVAVAETKAHAFKDGVYFIDLQPLQNISQIVPQIMNRIGCDIQADDQSLIEQLQTCLQSKQILLILDNCEHLLDGMTIINKILQATPTVTVLATSRQRLSLSGETVYTLNGLSLPQENATSNLTHADAVQFIMDCARRFRIGWQLTDKNQDHVRWLCHFTDGMPLAILLATSWLEVFELEQICERIQQDLTLLHTQLQDIPQQHKSITIIFEQTWQQLSTDERDTLIRMSFFQGGCDARAAETVGQATPQILQHLLNKALLIREQNGRYTMHELLRQFAYKRSLTFTDRLKTQKTHAHYYAHFLDSMTPQLLGLDRLAALLTIERDFANIQQAWEWACQHRDYFLINRMVFNLNVYCIRRARFPDFQHMMQRAHQQLLVIDDELPLSVKARFWCHYSDACSSITEKRAATMKALDYARQADDQVEIAYALVFLGIYSSEKDTDADAAIAYLKEALSISEAINEYSLANLALRHLGDTYSRYYEDVTTAETYLRHAITIAEDNDYLFGAAAAKEHLGYLVFYYHYHPQQAIRLYHDANDVFQRMGDHYNTASTTSMLARIHGHLGDFEGATYYTNILQQLAESTRETGTVMFAHQSQAQLHFMQGNYAAQYDIAHRARATLSPDQTHTNYLLRIQEVLALCGSQKYQAALPIALNNIQYFIGGDKIQLVNTLFSLCLILAYHTQDTVQATQGVALIQNQYPAVLNWAVQPLAQKLYQDLRSALSDADFGHAWRMGQQQDLQSMCETLRVQMAL